MKYSNFIALSLVLGFYSHQSMYASNSTHRFFDTNDYFRENYADDSNVIIQSNNEDVSEPVEPQLIQENNPAQDADSLKQTAELSSTSEAPADQNSTTSAENAVTPENTDQQPILEETEINIPQAPAEITSTPDIAAINDDFVQESTLPLQIQENQTPEEPAAVESQTVTIETPAEQPVISNSQDEPVPALTQEQTPTPAQEQKAAIIPVEQAIIAEPVAATEQPVQQENQPQKEEASPIEPTTPIQTTIQKTEEITAPTITDIPTQEDIIMPAEEVKVVKVYPVLQAAQAGIEKIKSAAQSMITYIYDYFIKK